MEAKLSLQPNLTEIKETFLVLLFERTLGLLKLKKHPLVTNNDDNGDIIKILKTYFYYHIQLIINSIEDILI